MLAGHYAAAYAAKAARPGMPMWALFVAAQGVDILWGVAVLAGLERASLDMALPSNPLVAEYMPYTHSLLGATLVALVGGLAGWRWRRSAGDGLAVALVVLAHWFCDLPFHRGDLSIYGEAPTVGFALWNHPVLAHGLELGLLAASVALLGRSGHGRRGFTQLAAVITAIQLWAIFAPPPGSVTQMCVSLLVFWLGVAGGAAWVERRRAASS